MHRPAAQVRWAVREDEGMAGHDGWERLAAAATPIDATTAAGLRRRQVPWVVQRVLLPVLWAALYGSLVAYGLTAAYEPCTAADPCYPDPWTALPAGAFVGTAVLVLLVPAVGFPVAVAFGVLDMVTQVVLHPDDGLVPVALMAAALGVAAVGTLLHRRAGRAHLPAAPHSGPLPVDGRERLVSRGWGAIEVLCALLAAAAVALTGVYGVLTVGFQDREARATATTAEVVAVDEEDWVLTLELADGSRTDVGTVEIDLYAVGDDVPVRVLAEDPEDPWVSLVAEPREADGWLVLAVGAAVLAGGLGWYRWRSLRARERLLREGGPVWATLALPDDEGAHVDLHALRLRARYTRTSQVDALLGEVGLLRQSSVTADDGDEGDEGDDVPPELRGLDEDSPEFEAALARLEEREWAEERELAGEVTATQAAFAMAWREARLPDGWDDDAAEAPADAWLAGRLPAPPQLSDGERVLLVGDPRPGGHVLVVTHDSLVAPFTPLEPAPPRWSALLEWWRSRTQMWLPPDPHTPAGTLPPSRADEDRADDGMDATGLPGVPAQRLAAAGSSSAVSDLPVQLRASRGRRAGWAVLLLVPFAGWLLLSEPPAWWQAAWAAFGLGGTILAVLSWATGGVRLSPAGVHVRGGFLVDVHAWSGVVGARVVDDEVVLAFGLDEDGDVLAAGGRPDRGSPAGVALLAERWRAAAPVPADADGWRVPEVGATPDPDLQRPLWPVPERRYPDPAVSTVLVLYVVAAVAALVGVYVL